MKRIELPISKNFYSRVIDMGEAVKDLASGKKVSFGPMDFGVSGKDLDQARQNGGQVIWCAICLEKKLELMLATFLFPTPNQCEKEKAFFTSQIIGADVLSYAGKKKLVLKIIKDQKLLIGEDKRKVEKILANAMHYRNAFAHGDITFHTDTGCILKHWQQGALKQDVLNDNYWEALEKCFKDAHDLSDRVISKLNSNIAVP